ncbi:MAG: lipopolysaccharide biosynthesis protein [Sphingomonadales bacterium]
MSIRKSLAWSFSQQFAQFGLMFIGSIVIARLLTPAEIGIFSLAMAASFFVSALREFGIGTYLIREEKLDDDKIRTAFGMWLLVSWTLGAALLFSRHWIADFYAEPGLADVIILTSVSFFVTPFGQPANALLMREMRFDILHHISLVCGVVGLATNITLAWLGYSYMALAWGLALGTVLRSILLISVRPRHITMLPSVRHWRAVMRFGGFMTLASILNTTNSEGLKFAMGAILTPSAVALFEKAVQMPTLARQAIFAPLGSVLTPAYAKAVRAGEDITGPYLKVIRYSTVLLWPAFLTLALLAQSVIVALFGENWRVAGVILPYLLASQAVALIVFPANQALIAHGKVKHIVSATAAVTSVSLASAILAMHVSLELFAQSRIPVAIVNVLIFGWCVRAVAGIGPRAVAKCLFKPALISVLGSAPAIGYRLTTIHDASLIHLIIIAMASVLCWFIAILLLKHEIMHEIKNVVSRF